MALCNPWTFYPVLGTTAALIGAGELDPLENRALREALTNFLFRVTDSIEDIQYVGRDAEQVWIAEIGLGGTWTGPQVEIGMSGEEVAPEFIPRAVTEDSLRMRNDRNMRGLVACCHLNVVCYITELERLRAGASRIMNVIEDSR